MYNDKVMKYFRNPKNMGEIENPDVTVEVGNPTCGDLMEVYMKVGEKDGERIIDDVKFKTFGCGAAIATSSVATELVMGESLETAENLEFDDISEALGGLPKIKVHCSQLASIAIHEAVYQFKKEEGLDISESLEESHERALKSLKASEEKREN